MFFAPFPQHIGKILFVEKGNAIHVIIADAVPLVLLLGILEQERKIAGIIAAVALLQDDARSIRISFDASDTKAQSPLYIVRRFSRRKLSVEPTNQPNMDCSKAEDGTNTEHCGGTPVEVPFNALGTLVFNTDEIPLNARFALASHVTAFHFKCGAK